MFIGGLEDNCKRYLAKHAACFAGYNIIVGCSAQFNFEKLFFLTCPTSPLHSNDVSLYSQLIADAMMGMKRPIGIKDIRYNWLDYYLASGDLWRFPALVNVITKIIPYEMQRSSYEKRYWKNHIDNFDFLLQSTTEKMRHKGISITDYFSGSLVSHFGKYLGDENAIFVLHLDNVNGGHNGYNHRINQIFQWDTPECKAEGKKEIKFLIDQIIDTNAKYILLSTSEIGRLSPSVLGQSGRNTKTWLYTNITDQTALFNRRNTDTGVRFELIDQNFRFSSKTKITFVKIKTCDIQYYKSIFLARNIEYWQGEHGFAVLANGKVCGFIEYSRTRHDFINTRVWYLLSDPPVEPKPHPTTSKLIVMIALSNEIREVLEYQTMLSSRGVITTARTKRPSSMKYRTHMKVIKRQEGELSYYTDWIGKSIKQMYREWWDKWGSKKDLKAD